MRLATSARLDLYDGWERYPLNLQALFPECNLDLCHQLLRKETERLFDPSLTDVVIETITAEGADGSNTTGRMTDRVASESKLEETLIVRIKDPELLFEC